MQGEKQAPIVSDMNYSKLACRTESPVTPEMLTRFYIAAIKLKELIEDQIALGERMDQLKKYLFYGKGLTPEHSELKPGEVEDRIIVSEEKVIRLLHSAIGISTEVGEFMQALYDHIYEGADLDGPNVMEELGDNSWYVGIGLDAVGFTLHDCLTINVQKLFHRFPERFTEEKAENRDLEGERKILEQKL